MLTKAQMLLCVSVIWFECKAAVQQVESLVHLCTRTCWGMGTVRRYCSVESSKTQPAAPREHWSLHNVCLRLQRNSNYLSDATVYLTSHGSSESREILPDSSQRLITSAWFVQNCPLKLCPGVNQTPRRVHVRRQCCITKQYSDLPPLACSTLTVDAPHVFYSITFRHQGASNVSTWGSYAMQDRSFSSAKP